MYKNNRVDIEQPEEEARSFGRVVEEIATKFGTVFPRMMALWTTVAPYEDGRRVSFPAVWR